MITRTLALLFVVSTLSTALHADVIIVDELARPGAEYVDLPAAVADALDGDVLLVRDGLYTPFTVVGKGLTIVADTGARIRLADGMIMVQGVPAGSTLTIDGMEPGTYEFAGMTIQRSVPVVLDANQGAVLLQDCVMFAHTVPATLTVSGGTTATLVDCELTGAHGGTGPVGAGLRVDQSEVFAARCALTGPTGAAALVGTGTMGGPGVDVLHGLALFEDCTLQGGTGGAGGVLPTCAPGGQGGTGLVIDGDTSRVDLRDTTVLGGLGGSPLPTAGPCADGPAGNALSLLDGSLKTLGGGTRGIAMTSPAREGLPATLDLTGVDGEFVFAIASFDAAPVYDTSAKLLLHSAAPFQILPLGQLPGAAQLSFTTPDVYIVTEGFTIQVQAAFYDPSTQIIRTSHGVASVLLDAAF